MLYFPGNVLPFAQGEMQKQEMCKIHKDVGQIH